MAELLAQWQKAYDTDTEGHPIKAEFLGQFGIEPVRLVFCRNEPSALDIKRAPDGVTSVYFTRQTLDWDAPRLFDKRVIVFGTREYRGCGSRISQPWSEEMKPKQSFLPIDLAVLHNPTIYLHAAAKLFTDVTEGQLEAIKRDMKPPSQSIPVSEPQAEPTQTVTPPTTPAPEDPFTQSLYCHEDRVVPMPARAEVVKPYMVKKKRARRQLYRGPQARTLALWQEVVGRHALSLSDRGNELGSRRSEEGGSRRFTVEASVGHTKEFGSWSSVLYVNPV